MPGRDHLVCNFCSTFHFPTPLADSADGVTPLGEVSQAQCPVCNDELSLGSIEENHVLYCERCRGVLIDGERFADVIRKRRAWQPGPGEVPRPLDPEQLKRKIECPVCGRPMDVHPYHGPGNAVIDSCCRCRVIWADHGEIAAIEKALGRC